MNRRLVMRLWVRTGASREIRQGAEREIHFERDAFTPPGTYAFDECRLERVRRAKLQERRSWICVRENGAGLELGAFGGLYANPFSFAGDRNDFDAAAYFCAGSASCGRDCGRERAHPAADESPRALIA